MKKVEDLAAVAKEAVEAELHKHAHPREHAQGRTTGQKAADFVARRSGWWPAIIGYLGITALYLIVNHWVFAFDVTLQYYTFLVSVAAIFLAQVILLSQNRQAEIENKIAHTAFDQIDDLDNLQQEQMHILHRIDALTEEVASLSREIHEALALKAFGDGRL